MPVSSSIPRVDKSGDGTTNEFSFDPMVIFVPTDLVVVKIVAGVETTVSPGTGAGNYRLLGSSFPGSSKVRYPASGAGRLAVGETLSLRRAAPIRQILDPAYQSGVCYLPDHWERGYDYTMALLAQIFDVGDAAARAAASVANIAALRARNSLTYNTALVGGYTAIGDGGGGVFSLVASDITSADNGGTIIVDAGGRRWYRQTFGAPMSIQWFGGRGDGTTDNLAAWNLMMAVVVTQTGGGSIVFPPGKYLFSANAAVNYPAARVFHLGIVGHGATLYWPNAAGGMTFNFVLAGHTIALEGMHITTGVSGGSGGGNGVKLTQTDPLANMFTSTFRDIVFRGDDNNGHSVGIYAMWWDNCAYVLNANGTTWDSITCYGSAYGQGTGLLFEGTGVGGVGGSNYSIFHNITAGIYNGLTTGICYGQYAQGMTINQCNFQNTGVGVLVPAGIPDGVASQLMITSSQFGCTLDQIVVLSRCGQLQVVNCDIFVLAGHTGIYDAQTAGITITGNNIQCLSSTSTGAIHLDDAASPSGYPSTISGNTINGAAIGIFLGPNTMNVNVSGNALTNCTVPTQDTGANNHFLANLGLPVGTTSNPSVTASPWVYATGNRPEVLYLSATTSIDGVTQPDLTSILAHATAANQPISFMLPSHSSIAVAYTGTLTAKGTKL